MTNSEHGNVIAILLVGGQGTRLGEMSRFVPKPLINIGVQPVINQIVEKLLKIEYVTTIYILSRRAPLGSIKNSEKELDFENWLTLWKNAWYSDERGFDKVKLVFEEDLPDHSSTGHGAILGLYRFYQWLKSEEALLDADGNTRLRAHRWRAKDHFLVCAADNFWEDGFDGILEEMRHYPNAIINAYHDFGDKEEVRNKYGVVKLRDSWIVDYEEKPQQPRPDQTRASTAIYIYPANEFEKIKKYMEAKRKEYPLDAPGHLLKWFVKSNHHEDRGATDEQQREGVRGYRLSGHWYDIGNKSDLMTAIIWFARKAVSHLQTVEDLKLVRQTEDLNDKFYFLCHQIEVNARKRCIALHFASADSICRLSPDPASGVISVGEVRERFRRMINSSNGDGSNYWDHLSEAFRGRKDFSRQRLSTPMLISGGVFFLDSTPPTWQNGRFRLDRTRTLLPLFERGAGAPADAGRLTTPAGRLDILDIGQASFSELAEEMICYGVDKVTDRPTIYCCAPPELVNVKKKILRRILEKNIPIHEIDLGRVSEQAKRANDDIDLIKVINPSIMVLPKNWAWSVEMYLDDDLQSQGENVILIPDPENATLEFRFMCTANITGLASLPLSKGPEKQVGKLTGIADGEGYRNRAFVFSVAEICEYYNEMSHKGAKAILDYLFQSQHNSVTALAVTDGQTGRFMQMDAKMPALTFTTSVRYLIDLLNEVS